MKLTNELNLNHYNSSTPLKVKLMRNSILESCHKVHAVVCDIKGRTLMRSGDPSFHTFIRSSLKPFQAIPFLNSGASGMQKSGEKGLAICCASHNGSTMHAREVFKLLWNADLDVNYLQCPIPNNSKSQLQHNCSGKHAGFLATCKKMQWPLETYLQKNHPLQKEIARVLSELLKLPVDELLTARDDCGAPTFLLQLNQMAVLYAHLGEASNPSHVQLTRAMLSYPELIAGNGLFDTELMNRSHGQLVSKGGAEGIQCISRIGEGIGLAIKVEDGSKRAKHAAALHLLNQLEWITPSTLQELEEKVMIVGPEVKLEVHGELGFQEN